MSRIDKTEDKVNKVFREYQDNWNKYAECLEKDRTTVKVTPPPPPPPPPFTAVLQQFLSLYNPLPPLPLPSPPLPLQEMVILHSYNAHNEYILHKTAFNALHDEFYGRQVSRCIVW